MDYNDIMRALAAAGMTEPEAKFSNISYAPRQPKGRPFSLLQKENVLRQRGWAFVWDERFWEYQRPGADVMVHQGSGYWILSTPPWNELLTDLREVTGWVPEQTQPPLLPVVE